MSLFSPCFGVLGDEVHFLIKGDSQGTPSIRNLPSTCLPIPSPAPLMHSGVPSPGEHFLSTSNDFSMLPPPAGLCAAGGTLLLPPQGPHVRLRDGEVRRFFPYHWGVERASKAHGLWKTSSKGACIPSLSFFWEKRTMSLPSLSQQLR